MQYVRIFFDCQFVVPSLFDYFPVLTRAFSFSVSLINSVGMQSCGYPRSTSSPDNIQTSWIEHYPSGGCPFDVEGEYPRNSHDCMPNELIDDKLKENARVAFLKTSEKSSNTQVTTNCHPRKILINLILNSFAAIFEIRRRSCWRLRRATLSHFRMMTSKYWDDIFTSYIFIMFIFLSWQRRFILLGIFAYNTNMKSFNLQIGLIAVKNGGFSFICSRS